MRNQDDHVTRIETATAETLALAKAGRLDDSDDVVRDYKAGYEAMRDVMLAHWRTPLAGRCPK